MKQKILVILMAMIAMLFSVSLAHAGQVTATHTILSQQQTASGVDVTLNITVSNQGASALSNTTIDMADLTLWAEPGTNVLTVGFLPVGGSINLEWNITSTAPQFMAGPPLAVQVNALDASGQSVDFFIMSAGE